MYGFYTYVMKLGRNLFMQPLNLDDWAKQTASDVFKCVVYLLRPILHKEIHVIEISSMHMTHNTP